MSEILDLINNNINNKINKIIKDLKSINSDINIIEQDIVDLQSNTGGSVLISLKDKYLYQSDFVMTTPQSVNSINNNWGVSGSGVIYDGLTDYDNIGGIRGCRRLHADINLAFYSYISADQTPVKPNSFTKVTFEAKVAINSSALISTTSNRILIGFVDNPVSSFTDKRTCFEVTCNNASRNISSITNNNLINVTTSNGTLNNLQFYKLKIVIDKLNSVSFYIDDVLVDTQTQIGTSPLYTPVFSINEITKSSNQNSAFVWIDWYELLIEYDAGNR